MGSIAWQTCRTVARAGVITLLLIGCESVEPEPPEGPEAPVGELRMEARSATRITGVVGRPIDSAPVVRLTTLDGSPAPGREVQFLVSGGGSIEVRSERTDTAGLASPGIWTLGTRVRPQTVTARSEGVADLVFTAVTEAGPPATISVVAGNHQTAAVGAPLPAPLQVRLADQYGNPVPEEPVSYTVALGNGTLLGDSRKTDSLGIASSGVWTLGDAGAQLVRTSAAGKTTLFEALACGIPCRGRELIFIRDGSLYSLVDGVATLLDNGVAEPAWAPNGQRIAYAVYEYDIDGEVETVDLYLMDADGSNAAPRANDYHSPSWSPDGRRLAVSGPFGIYTLSVEPDGAAPVLVAENASSPAWSPDGTKIAFTQYTDVNALAVMNSDGSAVTTLVRGDEGNYFSHPTWSPDGTKIAFTQYTDGPTLTVMNSDGSAVTALVRANEGTYFDRPTWSPDSRRLAFSKCDGSACRLFAVGADGTGLEPLSYANASRPAWSPDGSRIAFTSDGGIVWVPTDGPIIPPILMVAGGSSPAWRP